MKCLTDKECSEWLAKRGLTKDPYQAHKAAPPFYKQFRLPPHFGRMNAVFRAIVWNAEPFADALVHVTDWELYRPDEMEIVSRVITACGEAKPLVETPGHLFTGSERELIVGFIALVTGYTWSVYVYFDHGLTALSWEGELMDVWSVDQSRCAKICAAMQELKIEVTSNPETDSENLNA